MFRYDCIYVWDLPTAVWHEGEASLRETASRAIRECCGEKMRVQIVGNAPIGFYKETYSRYV